MGDGLEGVAGGPIGAEPEPVPSFLGRSAPGALVPGWEPGTGEAGWASAVPATKTAAVAAAMNIRMQGPPFIASFNNGIGNAWFRWRINRCFFFAQLGVDYWNEFRRPTFLGRIV